MISRSLSAQLRRIIRTRSSYNCALNSASWRTSFWISIWNARVPLRYRSRHQIVDNVVDRRLEFTKSSAKN